MEQFGFKAGYKTQKANEPLSKIPHTKDFQEWFREEWNKTLLLFGKGDKDGYYSNFR